MSEFEEKLKTNAKLVAASIGNLLDDKPLSVETERPARLMEAMRHSTLNGGKRIRPFLLIETAALFDVPAENSVLAATALELIHCYSLVHDDLPSMDDDDLRRGQPTTHKAYDEATAILAGDALLTLAFDVLSREETHSDAEIRIELVKLFARNSGLGGMVGGQMLDIAAESKSEISEEDILTLQSMKTGALLRCACEAGAVIGRASASERAALLKFGSLIGQAFQLADDILDVTSDAETMGKQTGKDAGKGKGTLVSLYGLDKARSRADDLQEEALATLEPFGKKASILIDAARFTIEREN